MTAATMTWPRISLVDYQTCGERRRLIFERSHTLNNIHGVREQEEENDERNCIKCHYKRVTLHFSCLNVAVNWLLLCIWTQISKRYMIRTKTEYFATAWLGAWWTLYIYIYGIFFGGWWGLHIYWIKYWKGICNYVLWL